MNKYHNVTKTNQNKTVNIFNGIYGIYDIYSLHMSTIQAPDPVIYTGILYPLI